MNVPKFRWRNAAQWERWVPRTIDGTVYSFEHLHDFDMIVSRPPRNDLPALRVCIRIVFDCHVVTESESAKYGILSSEDPSIWIDSGGRRRIFNHARYLRSLGLPKLIHGLATGQSRCYVSSHHNYMTCEQVSTAGRLEHYHVYFDLYRPGQEPRLVMYVQSAYVKDQTTAASRRHAKPFATLCAEKLGIVPRSKGNKKAP
jgi:hypothetical protein